jgi:ADP-ribosylglycohydrolase
MMPSASWSRPAHSLASWQLAAAVLDRARGVLLATAAGDALGAPYEFGPPVDPADVHMHAGGPWELGEWTDDTAMALAIAGVAAQGLDLRSPAAQDMVVARWTDWARDAKDVGVQTQSVLWAASDADGPESLSARARAASLALHEQTGRTAGNGALMRTAPVALAFLDNPDGLTDAARQLTELTHFDPENGEACILWCHLIRHAVLTGELTASAGLDCLPESARGKWAERLTVAASLTPDRFTRNGWVVEALMAAWCAIATTPAVPGQLARTLVSAVAGGRDADTVAAIAGGLVGALHGASQVPGEWRERLHGWPGLDAAGLEVLAGEVVALSPRREGEP